jgi:hypothetical protein
MQWLAKFGKGIVDFFETVAKVRIESEMKLHQIRQNHRLSE